jgi:hypothetical protein
MIYYYVKPQCIQIILWDYIRARTLFVVTTTWNRIGSAHTKKKTKQKPSPLQQTEFFFVFKTQALFVVRGHVVIIIILYIVLVVAVCVCLCILLLEYIEQSESAAPFGVRVRARVMRSTGGKNQLFVVARTRPASVALVETTPHEYYTTIIQYIIIIVVVELLLLIVVVVVVVVLVVVVVWRDIIYRKFVHGWR